MRVLGINPTPEHPNARTPEAKAAAIPLTWRGSSLARLLSPSGGTDHGNRAAGRGCGAVARSGAFERRRRSSIGAGAVSPIGTDSVPAAGAGTAERHPAKRWGLLVGAGWLVMVALRALVQPGPDRAAG